MAGKRCSSRLLRTQTAPESLRRLTLASSVSQLVTVCVSVGLLTRSSRPVAEVPLALSLQFPVGGTSVTFLHCFIIAGCSTRIGCVTPRYGHRSKAPFLAASQWLHLLRLRRIPAHHLTSYPQTPAKCPRSVKSVAPRSQKQTPTARLSSHR